MAWQTLLFNYSFDILIISANCFVKGKSTYKRVDSDETLTTCVTSQGSFGNAALHLVKSSWPEYYR